MNLIIGFFTIVLFLCLQNASWANPKTLDPCHPEINPSASQYIIGYGSLIQTQSKNKTYPNTDENLPAIIHGFERNWIVKSEKGHVTFLGVTQNDRANFNGVIFKLPSADAIGQYDQRESVYCRVRLDFYNLEMLNGAALPEGQFWMYIPKMEVIAPPSKDYPITQSYVDIFIFGCLEIQSKYHLTDFAYGCIDTTMNWSANWVNDRAHPINRDPADSPSPENIKKVNFLLETKLPLLFNEIKIKDWT